MTDRAAPTACSRSSRRLRGRGSPAGSHRCRGMPRAAWGRRRGRTPGTPARSRRRSGRRRPPRRWLLAGRRDVGGRGRHVGGERRGPVPEGVQRHQREVVRRAGGEPGDVLRGGRPVEQDRGLTGPGQLVVGDTGRVRRRLPGQVQPGVGDLAGRQRRRGRPGRARGVEDDRGGRDGRGVAGGVAVLRGDGLGAVAGRQRPRPRGGVGLPAGTAGSGPSASRIPVTATSSVAEVVSVTARTAVTTVPPLIATRPSGGVTSAGTTGGGVTGGVTGGGVVAVTVRAREV